MNTSIPKILHQFWTGDEMPWEIKLLCETLKEVNSDWEYKLWTEESIKEIPILKKHYEHFSKVTKSNSQSDIVRYAVLYEYGGMWCDTDIEGIKSFNSLIENKDLVIAHELPNHPHLICSCVIGSVKGNLKIKNILDKIIKANFKGFFGPGFLSKMLITDDQYIYPFDTFCPYYCCSTARNSPEEYPENTYCVHHWHATWTGGTRYIESYKKNIKKVLPNYPELVSKLCPGYDANFLEFFRKHAGQTVLLFGTGPTLNVYNDEKIPKSFIRIGVNEMIDCKKVDLDYYFIGDAKNTKEGFNSNQELYRAYMPRIEKFVRRRAIGSSAPPMPLDILNAKYYNIKALQLSEHVKSCDILSKHLPEGMTDCGSITFEALQFALWIGASRIVLIGQDSTYKKGNFLSPKNTSGEAYVTRLLRTWKKVKEFIDEFYPDVEVVSLNPVALDMFPVVSYNELQDEDNMSNERKQLTQQHIQLRKNLETLYAYKLPINKPLYWTRTNRSPQIFVEFKLFEDGTMSTSDIKSYPTSKIHKWYIKENRLVVSFTRPDNSVHSESYNLSTNDVLYKHGESVVQLHKNIQPAVKIYSGY